MEDVLARAQALIDEYAHELFATLPDEPEIFDAHVHLGTDIDGFTGDYDELEAMQQRYGISRCFMFCLDEPDRHPAFRAANDRTLAYAERSEGRLIPFVRLDLGEGPVEEATRCLDRGARGIKLHPRAQRFLLNDERLAPVFALAAERRVPILIHGGRGLPPIANELAALVERYPEAQLIIAHGGIADLPALAERFAGKAGVFFDTSVWSPIDLLSCFRVFSPEQMLYASDYPYGQQPSSLLIALRTAKTSGLNDDDVRKMLAWNASRIADGEPPLEPAPAKGGETFAQPMAFARIHQYLSMATPLLWTRQPDTVGVIGLALNACYDRDGYADERERIKELLSAARDLWRVLPEVDEEPEQRVISRATFRLIHIADILAVTPDA
jgi:predicted TIM-barrel fold metal-dependent hydrolase